MDFAIHLVHCFLCGRLFHRGDDGDDDGVSFLKHLLVGKQLHQKQLTQNPLYGVLCPTFLCVLMVSGWHDRRLLLDPFCCLLIREGFPRLVYSNGLDHFGIQNLMNRRRLLCYNPEMPGGENVWHFDS